MLFCVLWKLLSIMICNGLCIALYDFFVVNGTRRRKARKRIEENAKFLPEESEHMSKVSVDETGRKTKPFTAENSDSTQEQPV